MEATLGNWGNSIGVRISEACKILGLKAGDNCSVYTDVQNNTITLAFKSTKRHYHRHFTSLEELCKDYKGEKLSGELIKGCVGNEAVQ